MVKKSTPKSAPYEIVATLGMRIFYSTFFSILFGYATWHFYEHGREGMSNIIIHAIVEYCTFHYMRKSFMVWYPKD